MAETTESCYSYSIHLSTILPIGHRCSHDTFAGLRVNFGIGHGSDAFVTMDFPDGPASVNCQILDHPHCPDAHYLLLPGKALDIGPIGYCEALPRRYGIQDATKLGVFNTMSTMHCCPACPTSRNGSL